MNQIVKIDPSKSVLTRFAQNYGVDQAKVLSTLKDTCFKQKEGEVTDSQMMALLIVAEQHKLNPFTREIYAFPDKKSGIVPVVGVDGWSTIINRKPTFNGMDFNESSNMVEVDGGKKCPEWIECVIHDKNREHPVKAKEYLDEVYRPPFKGQGKNGAYEIAGPWQTHTKRMLRHKAMIQCARIAYGFSGIYDPDEAERIIEAEVIVEPREQISTEEINRDKVNDTAEFFKETMDADELNQETSDLVKEASSKLTNDEKIAVDKILNIGVPGNKNNMKYKNLLKKYLEYHPSQELVE